MKRKCTKCGEEKEFSEYRKTKATKIGITSRCRLCLKSDDADKYSRSQKGIKAAIKNQKTKYLHGQGKKLCPDCGEAKQFNEFHKRKKDKPELDHICKVCRFKISKTWRDKNADRIKKASAEYRKNNSEKCSLLGKSHYARNKEKLAVKHKEWRDKNRERVSELGKIWHKNNKDSIAARKKEHKGNNKEAYLLRNRIYETNRRAIDPEFKILKNLRRRLLSFVKKESREKGTIELLGCTISEVREYLEQQFAEGMSWDNYGIKGWHIDHIRPCASFDMLDPEQHAECFHWSNLQPLWAIDNIKKGSFYLGSYHSCKK